MLPKAEEKGEDLQGMVPSEEVPLEGGSNYLSFQRHYKVFIVIIAMLVVTNCISVLGYHWILPLKETKPVFIGVMDNKDFVFKMFPVHDMQGREALAKYFLRGYVVARETVDRVTEPTRVPQVQAMSSIEVFKVFRQLVDDPKSGLYHKDGFKRNIKILRDSHIAQKGSFKVHEMDFVTEDVRIDDGMMSAVERNEWNVKIAYRFEPQRVKADEDGSIPNPSGLNVIEYTVSHRRKL